jgi:Flp pilus assembly pilin Flp
MNLSPISGRRGQTVRNALVSFWRDESGQDLIEYALIVGMVVIGCAVFIQHELSPALSQIFTNMKESTDSAANAAS